MLRSQLRDGRPHFVRPARSTTTARKIKERRKTMADFDISIDDGGIRIEW